MLRSMTGFGAADGENEDYKIHAEIKSVNHRFLDVDFRMPRLLSPHEDALRRLIKKYAARGKFDVSVSVTDKCERAVAISVNTRAAAAYLNALNGISDALNLPYVTDVTKIAAFPDVLATESKTELPRIEEVLLPCAEEAMRSLTKMRETEGESIRRDFAARIETIREKTKTLADILPRIAENYRARLDNVVKEALGGAEFDETRIIAEVALFADRINYTEEIVRLESHFAQFLAITEKTGEPSGRKLDFLIQEMNRETNTIGSKANDADAAKLVVDIKSEIEKLREQVQNIE